MPRLPAIAVLLGLLGLVPLLGCAAAALWLPGDKGQSYLSALIAYAAVILSFLGAVHWGLVIGAMTPRAGGMRLVLGVMPALLGWVALLLAGAIGSGSALLTLIAGFTATIYVESRAAQGGLVPRGYMRLRWGLSAVVVLTLLAVTIVRFFGLKIIF
ncbi:MAG: DUF3429 domain-containing protein [Alphaproteobacteria bacterium]|nr:DUF3429 domain-containing protein [Alphaproteobacteria bacterium]